MDEPEKQELIRDLRQLRDAIESIHSDAVSKGLSGEQLIERYTSVTVKAVSTLDWALITLST
jgi:hypothetical protein